MIPDRSVAVIIAAYNVAPTIRDAVRSALDQAETAEVVVVDDASSDETAAVVDDLAREDSRVTLIRQPINSGPARARNLAIEATTSPFIAILDGDDILLPGRFTAMFAEPDWDFCADNIVFFTRFDQIEAIRRSFADEPSQAMELDFTSFVDGNIPRHGKPRGELGFLKPVMRREFLVRHDLDYAEDCRLGEDFLLYCEALAKGARYRVIANCGYAALVRENSLSGLHSVNDLAQLYRHESRLADTLDLSRSQEDLLRRRVKSTKRRLHHREVLAARNDQGVVAGIRDGLRKPTALVDIAKDRWQGLTGKGGPQPFRPRSLLTRADFRRDR
ncbi:MAG: glycosyltransferase family 2 protein [Erythrobacter sp.]|nr:glycosyltransferase family 2 protein [Erythrobacter sp.]